MARDGERVIDGVDQARVGSWLVANIAGATPPFQYERIGGGRSNITFRVTDGGGRSFVLRRPPLGQVLATAHDMTREYRAITAVGPTAVPVPDTLGLCVDEAVNGAPFYVMTLVDGEVVDSPEKAEPISLDVRTAMADNIIEVLASLHDLDVDAVGLGDFGRRDGYVERQLRRWTKQWEGSKTRVLRVVDEVGASLAQRIPAQQGVGVVHGDFRFGNCVTDTASGRIDAVLDWELCTLGDPLADLGYLGVFWSDDDGLGGRSNDPTAAGGFGSFSDAVARYAARSSRDLSNIGYYVAFQMWRSAIIMEGVYARYLHGAMGDEPGVDLDFLAAAPVELTEQAHQALARLS